MRRCDANMHDLVGVTQDVKLLWKVELRKRFCVRESTNEKRYEDAKGSTNRSCYFSLLDGIGNRLIANWKEVHKDDGSHEHGLVGLV